MVKLGEVCTLNMGQSPDSSSYNDVEDGLPFYQGNADFGVINPITRYWCNNPTKIAISGDILFSVRAPIGALNVAVEKCCIGRGLAAITANDDFCLTNYIKYILLSKREYIINQGTGSTFKAINKSILFDLEIPLPPLDEQKKIADELDKITSLIEKRKKQIEKLDLLVKAKFIEIFGDPVTNEMEWEVKTLKETTKISTGNTPPRNDKSNYGDFVEWIKTDNITDHLYVSSALEYLSEKGAQKGRLVDENNILMACIAGSIKSIGRVALTNRKVAFNQQINAVMPLRYNVLFLYILFKENQSYIQSTINMSLKGILSKGKMETLEFVVPPIDLQNQFADYVKTVEKTKQGMQKGLDELELLYKERMQNYFE